MMNLSITIPNGIIQNKNWLKLSPTKKFVWLVNEGILHWLQNDKHEWKNTKMIFDISTKDDKTILHFTHEGLVPEKECYARCEQGWTMVIKDGCSNLSRMAKRSKILTLNHLKNGREKFS